MRMLSVGLAAFALAFAAALAGATPSRSQAEPLTIYAAASLTEAFRALDPVPRYSFAGSNTLEAQIRQGAPADIFASAAPLNTQRLFRSGHVERPVTFTANRLALIVPRSNPAGIHSVYDLRRKPVKLVVAAPAVPVGAYTRTVLRKMGLSSVLSKVVSQESDVKAVTGKVALGQADAGFVYVTDARPVADQVTVATHPGVGAAARAVRDRGCLELDEEGRGAGVDPEGSLREGAGRPAQRRVPRASEGVVVNTVFRATLLLATGIALAFLLLPIAAIFLRVPPGDLVAALGDDAVVDALIVTARDEPRVAPPHRPLRNAHRLLDRHENLAPARRHGHARRASARAAAGGGRDRVARRVRPARVARRDVRAPRDRHRVHEGGGRPRGHVRGEPVLRAHGDCRFRGDRAHSPRRGPDARRRSREGVLPRRRAACRRAGSAPARRSRSHAGSASSAPRSCSPDRCRA